MKIGESFSWPQGVENSLVSDLEALWLLFGPQVASRPHLGAKMMSKWISKDPQGPQNHEKVMKMVMDF